jgi:hypothetical protein
MTSETRFATSFTSVWREVTPLSDGYWSIENLLAKRMSPPIRNRAPKELRGLVNELAFIAFCDLVRHHSRTGRENVSSAVIRSIPEAVAYINRVSGTAPVLLSAVDPVCIREASHISLRLLRFFPTGARVTVRPTFVGCGIVAQCEGDVLVGDCLYEVKAGDRGFRVSDLRQLLVYAALAYASDQLSFHRIGLFNPRTGLAWTRTLDEVCRAVSGLLANDVLPRIVQYLTPTSASR